jgi:hypothetical protein
MDREPIRQFRGQPSGITTPRPTQLLNRWGRPPFPSMPRRRRQRTRHRCRRPWRHRASLRMRLRARRQRSSRTGRGARRGRVPRDASAWGRRSPRARRQRRRSPAGETPGVLEEKAVHRALGCARREVRKRGPVLVDGPELVFRDRHLVYWFVLEAIRYYRHVSPCLYW